MEVSMPEIQPINYESADGKAKELLDQVRALLGATPSMTTTMARSAVLAGWLGLNGALRGGAISGADAERIALGVGEANHCSYCLSAHTYLARNAAGLDDEEIARARRFESEQARSAAILSFARSILATGGAVSATELAAAREAGLGDAELSEIVGHVALNVLTNYFNKAFGVDVDFPVVEPEGVAVA
jgi:uncharacterized peroxidase-related enzyme